MDLIWPPSVGVARKLGSRPVTRFQQGPWSSPCSLVYLLEFCLCRVFNFFLFSPLARFPCTDLSLCIYAKAIVNLPLAGLRRRYRRTPSRREIDSAWFQESQPCQQRSWFGWYLPVLLWGTRREPRAPAALPARLTRVAVGAAGTCKQRQPGPDT